MWDAVKRDPYFKILVWGPGEKSPHYDIRAAVRAKLLTHFAVVDFSEDLADDTPPTDDSWLENIAVRERLHATNADIVYLIPTSPGAQLELILYGPYRNIGPKLHVLLPDDIESGSFIQRVMLDILDHMPQHQVRRFPAGKFDCQNVADYCVEHTKAHYIATHPTGPPNLDQLF